MDMEKMRAHFESPEGKNKSMKEYYKLVRDKIPEIIKADGGECKFHVAKKWEFEILLFVKLREEINEFFQNPCANEIADILEVIETIARVKGIGLNDIKTQKKEKKATRGGFNKKIVLEIATEKNK